MKGAALQSTELTGRLQVAFQKAAVLLGVFVNRPNSVHSFPDDQFGSGARWFGTAKLSSAARVGSTHAGACGWLWPPP